MVSTKFYSDYDELEVFASAWAEEGRIDVERLKQLEMSFLNAIQWNILVSENEFHEKLKTVERLLAMKEGLSRGWFTYTELEMLMPTIEIAKRILNYTTILMFSYACSIATIALSSVILASIPVTSIDRATSPTNVTTSPSLLPDAMISTDNDDKNTYERSFDDPMLLDPELEVNLTRNFTINYPLFDRVTNWATRKNYRDVNNFYLTPQKYDPVPLGW